MTEDGIGVPASASHAARDALRGVVALEWRPGTQPAHAALAQSEAARLGELLGRDLAALAPAVRELDLVLGAAHFDPAEALRAGWPLHRRLLELHARAPRAQAPHSSDPRILVFGADARGEVPQPLRADEDLRGGPLRVLPFALVGAPDALAATGDALESLLFDRGMAQADTALHAQEAFDARIEHARYLTAHDLAAMTALQYRHAGLDALWPLVETALLAPDGEAWLDAPPEPLVRYAGGEAHVALFDPQGWQARYAPGDGAPQDADALARGFAYFEARQRQIAAVLQAHGIPVVFEHCTAREDARRVLEA